MKTMERTESRLDAICQESRSRSEVHREIKREQIVLEVEHFNLWYGEAQAIFDISMAIPRGKGHCAHRPSGCGKSTLLRSVNRLNDLIDVVRIQGDMLLNGDSIYDPDRCDRAA